VKLDLAIAIAIGLLVDWGRGLAGASSLNGPRASAGPPPGRLVAGQ